MNPVLWAVIKREYLQKVRTKAFVLSTIAIPLIFGAYIALMVFMARSDARGDSQLGIVDQTGVLYGVLEERLENADFSPTQIDAGVDLDSLKAAVADGEPAQVLILDQESLDAGRMTLWAEDGPSVIRRIGLTQVVVQTILAQRLSETDATDIQSLLAGGDLEVEELGEAASLEGTSIAQGFLGSFVLYMAVLIYGMQVMRSVLEEKRDRVVEVVISAMRPYELMLGKILGVGAVGLTQMGIWVVSFALMATVGLPAAIAAFPDALNADLIDRLMPGLTFVAYLLIYFTGGFFLFSSLYAAVGAMCSTDEEAQQAQTPVTIMLILPMVFMTAIVEDPTSTFATVTSLVPFFSPVLMFARAVGGAAPLWQVGLSVVLMALSIMAVAWVAARIYKVGILMSGKRPTLPELMRWVRQA